MKPSETDAGQAWLENFSEPDLPAATLLLDSLRFVSLSKLRNRLKAFLETLQNDGALAAPALVVPERNLKEFADLAVPLQEAVAYRDFQPGAPIRVTPGSVGLVGGILRDFAPAGSNAGHPWIAPDANLEALRARRCRSIVLVTDYVGSGNQIATLAATFARHPTLKSWRSLRRLKIHVVAFAAQPQALKRLDREEAVDSVWAVEVAPTGHTAPWEPAALDAITNLCRTECRWRAALALGYGDSFGLFVTERGAPNNLPAVFLQDKWGWQPLFPRRTVPAEFAEQLSDYRPSESLAELAERVGQLRMGRNKRLDSMPPASRRLLRALVSVGHARRDATTLAAELAIDLQAAVALLDSLHRFGFVTDNGRITDAGQRELAAQKRARRYTTAALEGSDAVYYPRSLK